MAGRPLHHHSRLAFDMVVLFLGLGYLDHRHIFTLQADVHICSNMQLLLFSALCLVKQNEQFKDLILGFEELCHYY